MEIIEVPVRVSAGCLIILNNSKVLLGHPTNNSWANCFSPPKGGVDVGETLLQAAVRETKEEMSIDIDISKISNIDNPILIEYNRKGGKIFKKVYLYIIHIGSVSEIGLTSEVIDKSNLQIEELDWAGFLEKDEAKVKIFHRFWGAVNDLI